MIFFNNCFGKYKIGSIFAPAMNRLYYLKSQGTLAQMVEQWTENPCVPGSIPGGTTLKIRNIPDKKGITDFLFYNLYDYCTIDDCSDLISSGRIGGF